MFEINGNDYGRLITWVDNYLVQPALAYMTLERVIDTGRGPKQEQLNKKDKDELEGADADSVVSLLTKGGKHLKRHGQYQISAILFEEDGVTLGKRRRKQFRVEPAGAQDPNRAGEDRVMDSAHNVIETLAERLDGFQGGVLPYFISEYMAGQARELELRGRLEVQGRELFIEQNTGLAALVRDGAEALEKLEAEAQQEITGAIASTAMTLVNMGQAWFGSSLKDRELDRRRKELELEAARLKLKKLEADDGGVIIEVEEVEQDGGADAPV